MKKVISFFLALVLTFSLLTLTVSAAEPVFEDEPKTVEELANDFNVTIEELENLNTNLEIALEKAEIQLERQRSLRLGNIETKTVVIQVSENITLENTTKNIRATNYNTLTNSYIIRGGANVKLADLSASARYSFDRVNANILDISGTYTSFLIDVSVSNKSAWKEGSQAKGYVDFNVKIDLSIGPVGGTVTNEVYTCSFTIMPNGDGGSSWRRS